MNRSIRTVAVETCNNCGSSAFSVVARSRDFEYDTCENEFCFVRCSACGLVYLRDRPDIATLGIIYPAHYIPYEFNEYLGPFLARARNYVQARKVAPLAAHAPTKSLIVDVGCGSGEFLRILKQHGPSGWRLIGVDIATPAIDNLARLGIEARQGRFETMDWNLPQPDVIVMNQVIEHLDDPAAVVRRAHALLKPGGILMIETPSVDAWDAAWFRKRYWGGWHTPRHWTLYTPKTLGDLLRSSGFAVVETKHILSPNFWLQSLHHWMSEGGSLKRKLAPYFDVSHFLPLAAATAFDMLQLILRGRTSNFRMVGRKETAAGIASPVI
jgi:2-polyprenyl-3-methyl-5-hydroxy-6-metoxy-1,4-benzoquinol methylase